MCTVTWIRQDGGYLLLSNRDERPTRKPAAPPEAGGRQVRYIAPLDGDHGGSWIGVNEFGLSVCLLNGGQPSDPPVDPAAYTSRGMVVLHLLESISRDHLRTKLSELELARFRPFSVLALEPDEEPLLLRWSSDRQLSECTGQVEMPLFSSAREPAVEARRQHFASLLKAYGGLEPDLLYEFHSSHMPEPGPLSTCMHRQESSTVSFSRAKVTRDSIELVYYPASPCKCDLSLFGISRSAPGMGASGETMVAGTAVRLQRQALPAADRDHLVAP